MTHIKIENMTVAELCAAIERHMAEAEIHMETAQHLLDLMLKRKLDIEPWVH